MKDIKKLMITLVALLAVTTGAWAQGPWTSGECTVTLNNGTLTVSGNGAMADYDNLSDLPWINNSGDITSVVVESGVTSVGMSAFCSLENITSVTLPEGLTAINDMAFNGCNSLQSITLPEGLTAIGGTAFASCSSLTSITIPSTVTSIGNMAFLFCSVMSDVYIYAPSLTTYGADAFNYNATGRKIYVLSDAVDTYKAGWPDYAADFVGDLQPLASGPEVAWNKAEKTGTFTMPGGNVTLEPEYYTQATVADGGVTAADADARATTDDPLVKVDATKLTGATKLMYFVSNSGTTAPAYDAEGWTDQLPTAEGITQQGIVYVWYYPVGTDEGVDDATATYSDGDICLQSIIARIAPEPTYTVEFAEGTDANEWKAEPNTGVKKGQPVTVTYTGAKKVIGVKAEKKGGAAGIVNPAVGQVIGSDGNNYDANATLPDGVTKVAMIAYVSGSNGLAIALADEGIYTWDNSSPSNKGKTAPEICSALNTSKAVTGGTWKLPSKDEWKQMFSANGGNEGSYTGLNNALAAAGGESSKLVEDDEYWSSSEVDDSYAWLVSLAEGNASWDEYGKHYNRCVRACLAF